MPYEDEPVRKSNTHRVIFGAVVFMVFGSVAFGYFYGVDVVWVILYLGSLTVFGALAVRGLVHGFEAQTPIAMTPSGPVRLANPEGILVKVEVTEVNIAWLKANGVNVDETSIRKTKDGKRIQIGSDERGRSVSCRVYLLGGLKKKSWWINTEGGELGALIVWGDGDVLPVHYAGGTSLFITRTLRKILPSQVPPEVSVILKDKRYAGRFEFGTSPIYRLGSPSPDFDMYIVANRDWVKTRIELADASIPQQGREDTYHLIGENLILQARVNALEHQNSSLDQEVKNLQLRNEAVTGTLAKVANAYTQKSAGELISDRTRGREYDSSGGGGSAG